MSKALVLEGGRKPRRRAAHGRDWTQAKEDKFIEALADSGNVTHAAAVAGVSSSAAYRRKATDASFRAAWARAVSAGFSQLEIMLLERALHGVEKPVTAKGGAEGVTMRHYDNRTAPHRTGAAADAPRGGGGSRARGRCQRTCRGARSDHCKAQAAEGAAGRGGWGCG